jgi:tetratricopeptide (TPR) repeat protein
MWLKAFLQERNSLDIAIAAWDQVVAAEEKLLDKPTETNHKLIFDLLRREIGLLDKLNRPGDSERVIKKLVQIQREEPAPLLSLLDWLRERQSWGGIDEMATRFSKVFDKEPVLAYALAQARQAQGNIDQAEEIAVKAFASQPDQLELHIILASQLQQRGLNEWADREFGYLIEKYPLASQESVRIRLSYSEYLHDRLRDAEAAQVLRPLVEASDRKDLAVLRMLAAMQREPGSTKSRMLFFEASAAAQLGDLVRQRHLLDQGIAADPTDADVLIGLYRVPNQTSEQRQKLKDLIVGAVKISRKEIEDNPDDPTPYNQMAWLVANTEGDFDEAIRLSQKSIELLRAGGESRSVGGYLDTLAHCYFAKGDFENAVKTQTEAASLETNSDAIRRQLKVFQKALDEQRAQKK